MPQTVHHAILKKKALSPKAARGAPIAIYKTKNARLPKAPTEAYDPEDDPERHQSQET